MASVKDIYIPEEMKAVRDRFMSKVVVDAAAKCWTWTGSCTQAGYGRFGWSHPRLTILAHRASLLIFRGLNAGQSLVCHRCNNPRCVNPDHLFVGTNAESMDNARRKGRTLQGRRNPLAKLTDGVIHAIRNDPRPQRSIAADYGVSQDTIHNVKARKRWAHI